jgi:hypothetical protein
MEKSAILFVDIEKLDIEAAARVAQRFVLQEINLVNAKISRDPLIISPEALTLEHKCSTDSLSSPDKEKYLVLCNFRVTAFDSKNPSKLVMDIETSFCTSYFKKPDVHIPDDVDSLLTHAEYLGVINPIYDTWPYWREFVQSMSARMGFPALTVPLLEIRPKKSEAAEVQTHSAKSKSPRRKKLGT